MKLKKMLTRGALIAAMLIGFCDIATAGQTPAIQTPVASVQVNLTVGESLTLTATPSSVTFGTYNAAAGTAAPTGTITVTTTAVLGSSHTELAVFGGFPSGSTALSNGAQTISASSILASVNGGTATGPSNSSPTVPNVGSATAPTTIYPGWLYGTSGVIDSLHVVTGGPNYSLTDTVALSLTGQPNLVPGSYTGTISFVAAVY